MTVSRTRHPDYARKDTVGGSFRCQVRCLHASTCIEDLHDERAVQKGSGKDWYSDPARDNEGDDEEEVKPCTKRLYQYGNTWGGDMTNRWTSRPKEPNTQDLKHKTIM